MPGELQQLVPDVEQLVPDVEQVVGTEIQRGRKFGPAGQPVLPEISEPDKRIAPLPSMPMVPVPPDPIATREAEIRQNIFGIPIVRVNQYIGSDTDWVEVIRWDVSPTRTGDLHEISILSDDDSKTRYRIFIGGFDQGLPEDRDTSTPLDMPWQRTVLPPETSIVVQIRSTDGTEITVDAMLTGSER